MPPCPACDAALYGWAQVEPPGGGAPILLQRCEQCGLAIVAGTSPGEAIGELFGESGAAPRQVRVANRRSLQAALGGRRWAALDPERRRVYATPEALRRLAARAGLVIEQLRSPLFGRGQRWMWQTIVNAFTLRPNLARDSLAGRVRPRGARQRLAYALDWMITILATPLTLLFAVPLELAGAATGRGGELIAVVRELGEDADGGAEVGVSAEAYGRPGQQPPGAAPPRRLEAGSASRPRMFGAARVAT